MKDQSLKRSTVPSVVFFIKNTSHVLKSLRIYLTWASDQLRAEKIRGQSDGRCFQRASPKFFDRIPQSCRSVWNTTVGKLNSNPSEGSKRARRAKPRNRAQLRQLGWDKSGNDRRFCGTGFRRTKDKSELGRLPLDLEFDRGILRFFMSTKNITLLPP